MNEYSHIIITFLIIEHDKYFHKFQQIRFLSKYSKARHQLYCLSSVLLVVR